MKALATVAAAAVLIPSLALAQKTNSDYDKSTNFATFRTYALKDGTKVGDPLIDNRIVAAIEAELATTGLTKDDTKPDIFVVYHIALDKEKDISAWSTGAGPYGWRYGMASTDVQVRQILIGTLVLDIADANKGAIVWRGVGVKEVDPEAKPEKRDKNIREAVKKILKNYPPKTKST